MKRQFGLITVLVLVATFVFGSAGTVGAAGTTVVVTPTNTQGWSTADTRPGGAVMFVDGDAPPGGGTGSLQLTTAATNAAKAQYIHAANTPLAAVTELGYSTKRISGPDIADASFQVVVCLLGAPTPATSTHPAICPGYTTLVFEPYENGTVGSGWQTWNVATGQLWSSTSVADGTCNVSAGFGGPPFYTLGDITSMCRNAIMVGFGVNLGSYNPSWQVLTDLIDFNGTTYDFEKYSVPINKDQCKDGGYKTFNPPSGPYKNQGQCVSSTNHQGDGND